MDSPASKRPLKVSLTFKIVLVPFVTVKLSGKFFCCVVPLLVTFTVTYCMGFLQAAFCGLTKSDICKSLDGLMILKV